MFTSVPSAHNNVSIQCPNLFLLVLYWSACVGAMRWTGAEAAVVAGRGAAVAVEGGTWGAEREQPVSGTAVKEKECRSSAGGRQQRSGKKKKKKILLVD